MRSYTFLSYAHKDWETIEPYFLALEKRGHHIWYDKDILPGTEWIETIAERLKNAASCILFLSPDALNSYNVRREIHFAAANNIPIIAVAIKPFELSQGLQLELSDSRFLYPDQFQTFENCIDEISAFLSAADSRIYRANEITGPRHLLLKYCLSGFTGMIIALLIMRGISTHTLFQKGHKADYYNSISEFAEDFYKLANKGDEKSFQRLWDNYMSETTKQSGIITEEEWIRQNLDEIQQHKLEILDYNVISIETLPGNAFFFTSRMKYTSDGEQYSKDYNEYLVVEDQVYKYLYNGILKTESFEGGDTSLDGIRLTDIEIKEYADRLALTLTIQNCTESEFLFGQIDPSHFITVETTAGSYTGGVESSFSIKRNKSLSLEAQFQLVSGTPKQIILNGVSRGETESVQSVFYQLS